MANKVSVVLCSHNSRADYLGSTLGGLEKQSLSKDFWELVLIDNLSDPPVDQSEVQSVVPNGRVVVEPELGLTFARLRGIKETSGDLLVFVDDDNVLETGYLENALNLSEQRPEIGVFGGSTVGVFESPVLAWMKPHLGVLAVREVVEERIGGGFGRMQYMPFGAGMVMRREVASAYLEKVEREPIRLRLDRCGKSFLGGGDRDMVRTAALLDLQWGLFPSLRLDHLIGASRVEEAYFLKLWQGGMAATQILNSLDGVEVPRNEANPLAWPLKVYRDIRSWKRRRLIRSVRRASEKTVAEFFEMNRSWLEAQNIQLS